MKTLKVSRLPVYLNERQHSDVWFSRLIFRDLSSNQSKHLAWKLPSNIHYITDVSASKYSWVYSRQFSRHEFKNKQEIYVHSYNPLPRKPSVNFYHLYYCLSSISWLFTASLKVWCVPWFTSSFQICIHVVTFKIRNECKTLLLHKR